MEYLSVSVCIPTYNQEAFIEQAVKSAAAQTYPAAEIIVSDDASTDDTWKILLQLSTQIPALKIFRQPANKGISANVDDCLRMATGEFILRLDSDDYLSPDYLAKLVPLLRDNPSAGYAHAAVQEVDQNDHFLKKRLLSRGSGFQTADEALKAAASGFRVAANIILFRKAALVAVNYIACDANFAEDYYLAASLAAAGYGNVYLGGVLSYYRVWTDTGKLRHRRKLAEITGITRVFDEVLAPAFRQRGWNSSVLDKERAARAASNADALAWNVYTNGEKKQIGAALLGLSSSAKVKVYIWLYHNGLGWFPDTVKYTGSKLKYMAKSCVNTLKKA